MSLTEETHKFHAYWAKAVQSMTMLDVTMRDSLVFFLFFRWAKRATEGPQALFSLSSA